MAGYETVHLDEVDTIAFDEPDQPNWKPLRHRLGVGAFGFNAWVAEPGELVIERHDEKPTDGDSAGHEEVYVVLRGSADFTVGADTFAVREGSIVFVRDPSLTRKAVAREPATTVLTVGAARGAAFEPSPWERRWLEAQGVS
jgi:hypothetical protein